MLYAYIDGIYTEVENLKVERVLNSSGKVTFTCPAMRFPDPFRDFQNAVFKIYFRDDVLIDSGIIESNTPGIKNNTTIDMITFSGTDEIGLLSTVGAKSNGNYQDQPKLFIIDDILSKADSWRLGYSYGVDTAQTFTIDLQDKETLLAQLVDFISKNPDFFFRYGGTMDDYYLLDVGLLGTKSNVSFVQGVNLESIKRLPQSTKILYEIEGFGGTIEGLREVYLSDAYDYDNTLANHPRYPIVNKSDGTWVVRDLLYSNGDSVLKRFNDIKPVNASPSTPEIEQAGYALWQACVSEFQKANQEIVTYEATQNLYLETKQAELTEDEIVYLLSADGDILYTNDDIPILISAEEGIATPGRLELNIPTALDLYPGDTCFFSGNVSVLIYNHHIQNYEWRDAYKLHERIFISDVSFEFKNNKVITLNVKTGTIPYKERYNDNVILAKKTDDNKESSLLGVGYAVPVSTGVTEVSQTQSNIASDTTMADGFSGKLFSLAMPSVPLGTTELRFSVYSTNPNVIIETVQNPSLPSSGYIAKVRLQEGDWTVDNSATLYGVYIFS